MVNLLAQGKRTRRILKAIKNNPGKNLTVISKECDIGLDKISVYVAAMIEIQWVTMQRDGNEKLVYITDTGEYYLKILKVYNHQLAGQAMDLGKKAGLL